MAHLKIAVNVPYGTSIKVGYRVRSSGDAWTYFAYQPKYDDVFPYTFAENIPPGDYEVEITGICSSCSGDQFTSSQIIYPTVY